MQGGIVASKHHQPATPKSAILTSPFSDNRILAAVLVLNGDEWWKMMMNGDEWWRMVMNAGEW